MNKTVCSVCHLLPRSVIILTMCALFFAMAVQPARADGAPPPEPSVGGMAPYRPIETKVQMMSETVLIDALPNATHWTASEYEIRSASNQIRVKASFTMQNRGETEEKMQVVFPLTRLDYPDMAASYNIIPESFVARVNGKIVPTQEITTPPELGISSEVFDPPEGFFLTYVHWAAFDATFPVHQDVLLQVEYSMDGGDQGLHHIDYILETGAGWYGRILSADITVRLPYPATSESVPAASSGYTFSGNEVRWKMQDFEPKRKDNLSVGFIDTNRWPLVLEQRSRVEQNPDDAMAWYRLGNLYNELGLWYGGDKGVHVTNQHLVDLSMLAFKKAIAIRPDWGDAHMHLANVMWFAGSWNAGPSAEQVARELKLAAAYGITEDRYDYLASRVRRLGFSLPTAIQFTPTPAAPTPTPGGLLGTTYRAEVLAAGFDRTCVLTKGAELKCSSYPWDRIGPAGLVAGARSVVAGYGYTCLLTAAGGVQCMGKNDLGQLGDGTTLTRTTYVDVTGLSRGVETLVAGDSHTCALLAGGEVKCWGRNYFGQLGNGTTAYSLIPVAVDGLADGVASLAAGSDHTCAFMLAGGIIRCWGANDAGQLGDGSLTNRARPVAVVGLPAGVITLDAGFMHTCALTTRGEVWCWGDNSRGQLGNDGKVAQLLPVKIPGLDRGVRAVVAGNGYNCVLTAKGGVKCWGNNYFGQLGDGTNRDRAQAADVVGLSGGVTGLVAGDDHTCALLQDGEIKCWGMRAFGQDGIKSTGMGEPISRLTPVAALELGLIQATQTPLPDITETPGLPTATPTPPKTVAPKSASSTTTDAGLAFGLLIVVGGLVFFLWRARQRRQDEMGR